MYNYSSEQLIKEDRVTKKLFGVIVATLCLIPAGILPARAGEMPLRAFSLNPSNYNQPNEISAPQISNPIPVYPWTAHGPSDIAPNVNPILSPVGSSITNPYSQETTDNDNFSSPPVGPAFKDYLGSEESATEDESW